MDLDVQCHFSSNSTSVLYSWFYVYTYIRIFIQADALNSCLEANFEFLKVKLFRFAVQYTVIVSPYAESMYGE